MNQAEVNKLVSALKFTVQGRYRNLKNSQGSEGRLDICRKIVTALFKYERLELNQAKADEARGYAERLISDAIRHGDKHKETFDMANYWILDKGVLHKLFKVLVPRFENFTTSYSRMINAPQLYPAQTGEVIRHYRFRSILELKGHPYPPIFPNDKMHRNRNYIHNILLSEAKKEYYLERNRDTELPNDSEAMLSSPSQEMSNSKSKNE